MTWNPNDPAPGAAGDQPPAPPAPPAARDAGPVPPPAGWAAPPPAQPYGSPPPAGPGGPGPGGPGGGGPRRGLPIWVWVVLGVLVLALVGGIVAAVLIGSHIANSVRDAAPVPIDDETILVDPDDPEETTGPDAGFVTYYLDDVAMFDDGPFWTVGVPGGDWEIVRFDEAGVNEFENPALQCTFLTYQGLGDGTAPGPDGDLDPTYTQAELVAGQVIDSTATDVELTELGTEFLPAEYGAAEVEFLFDRYDFSDPASGTPVTVLMLTRAFTQTDGLLAAHVTCPTAVIDGADSPVEDTLLSLSAVSW